MLLDCLKKLGKGISSVDRAELKSLYADHSAKGLSEYDASMAALTDFHKGLHDSMNELRTSVRLRPVEYQPFDPTPINTRYEREAQVEAKPEARIEEPVQPPLETRPSGVVRVAESSAINPEVPRQWQHRDFGLVTESENQSGTGKGRVRVTAEDGSMHVIQRADLRGAGNQIAIPVKTQRDLPPEAVQGIERAREDVRRAIEERRMENLPTAEYPAVPPAETTPPPSSASSVSPEPVTPTTPAEVKPSQTAPKDVAMQADRAELGLPELERLPKVSAPEVLTKAKAENEANPREVDTLVNQALEGGKNFTNVETMRVNLRAQEIKNRVNELNQEIYQATDPDTIAQKRAEQDGLINEFSRISEAQDKAGAEWSRAGTARQRAINQDFDLVSMVARMKKAKGRELNVEEQAKIETQSRRISELETQLAEAQEVAKTKSIQREIDRTTRRVRRTENKQILDAEFESLKAEFAQIKAKEAGGFFKSERGALDPDAVKVIGKMARNRVRAGVTDAAQLVDDLHAVVSEHLEGVSKREVRDAISGYGIEKRPNPRSAAEQQLAQVRSALKKLSTQEDIAAGKRLSPRDKTRQTQLRKQEADLQRRLSEKDFSKVERTPVAYTKETARLQRQVDELKQRYQRQLYRATRSTGGKISDVLVKSAGVPKTIKSMGDISAVFRQGGFYAITHPYRGLALPFKDMIHSFSDAGYRNVENTIKSHPKFEQSVKDGVEYTGVNKNDPNLSKHEENYLGDEYIDLLARGKYNVPGKAVQFVKDISERTFISFLDSQRMNMYDVMTDGLTNPSRISRLLGAKAGLTEAQLKADRQRIAKAINAGTGRGNLGRRGNQAAPLLNIAMFSPKLLASRVQLLNQMFNPGSWYRMPRNARAEILQDNVKFLAATAGVLALAKSMGGQVSLDPDDSEFLKTRFGDTVYDTLTGLQQPLRYIINMSRGLSPISSKTLQTGQYYAGEDPWKMTGRFVESKGSPVAGMVIESIRGSDYLGRKRTIGERALDVATPLPSKDVIEGLQQGGVLGALKATPTFTGIGVGSYPAAPEKPTTLGEKMTRKLVRAKMPDEARTTDEIDRDQKLAALRARARRGEDVSKELSAIPDITEKRRERIRTARGVSRLQEDFKQLSLKDALAAYPTLSSVEQESVKSILGKKAISVDLLPLEDQADVRQKLKDFGFKPGMQVPKRPPEPDRPNRPNPRAWSYQ